MEEGEQYEFEFTSGFGDDSAKDPAVEIHMSYLKLHEFIG
jgi:hypothetical protein